MYSSKTNWTSLYKLQDEVLHLLRDELSPFYLTGGTALSRYYLNHRYSEDLDLFCHDQDIFEPSVNKIARLLVRSKFLKEQDMQISETYARFYVGPLSELKIDFVYESVEHIGAFKKVQGINIDNPKNILTNKICCILGRDEPKDVYDIVSLAQAYSFNWREVVLAAKRKQVLDEADVAIRLEGFPTDLLENINWAFNEFNIQDFDKRLKQIIRDISLGNANFLGEVNPDINTVSLI